MSNREIEQLKRQVQGLEHRNDNLQCALMYAIDNLIPKENIPPGARNNPVAWLINQGHKNSPNFLASNGE